MLDHAFVYGWSKDGKEFGYCMVSGGSGGTHCEFQTPAGKSEKVDDFDRDRGEPDEARNQALRARIAARGYAVTAPAWPYARDLVLTWRLDERKEGPQETTPPRLLVGATPREKKSFTPALTLVPLKDRDWFSIHPEAIAVSPDGKFLGVISHSFAGEFSDTFAIRIAPTSVIAGQAYNDEGLALHRAGRFGEAALWFHRAAHTNPESKVAFYNLACALARSGKNNVEHESTEAALRRAIEVGGAEVRAKARADEDFSSVRGEAWFQNLTSIDELRYDVPIRSDAELRTEAARVCREAKQAATPILLDVGADWCGDCRALYALERQEPLRSGLVGWKTLSINLGEDHHEWLRAAFGIKAIARWLVLAPTDCNAPLEKWPVVTSRVVEPKTGSGFRGPDELVTWLAEAKKKAR